MTDELHPQLPDTEGESVPRDETAGATPTTQTYEAASERLEEIIKRLDSGTAGLRETLDLVKEARALIDYCATELDAVGKGLDELRLDDLITRLESDGRTP
jgi:exodeoxyribonuclease VII small subunit